MARRNDLRKDVKKKGNAKKGRRKKKREKITHATKSERKPGDFPPAVEKRLKKYIIDVNCIISSETTTPAETCGLPHHGGGEGRVCLAPVRKCNAKINGFVARFAHRIMQLRTRNKGTAGRA